MYSYDMIYIYIYIIALSVLHLTSTNIRLKGTNEYLELTVIPNLRMFLLALIKKDGQRVFLEY